MIRLVWTPRSQRDIAIIAAYLLERDVVAASVVVRAIQARAQRLREYPLLGEVFESGPLRKLSLLNYPYILIYKPSDGVEMVRVYHQSQDWRPR